MVAATRASAGIPLGVFAHLDEGRGAAFLTPLGAIRHALLERAGDRPLVLLVDDAHALDTASAALVHHLSASRDATVIATVRSGEVGPDAVTALWKDGGCDRIDLQPLSERETGALLRDVLGGDVDVRTRHDLWEATQGNLLFLKELVDAGCGSGALGVHDGWWRWTGPMHAPSRVSELVALQLDAVGADERLAIELVALGEPLEWEILRALAPGADAALASGLIVAEPEEGRLRARMWHPLVGDVVQGRIAAPRRQQHFRSLASSVESSGARRRHDVLRIVTWRRGAGDAVDPASLTEAARRCVAVDPGEAESLARMAIDAGGGLPAVIVLAQQLMFSRRAIDAAALLEAPPVEPETLEDETALTVMRANNLTFGLGRGSDAVVLLDELRARVDDRAVRSELTSQTVPMLLFAGEVDESNRRAGSLVDDMEVDLVDRLRARITRVAGHAVSGRPETAQQEASIAFSEIGGGIDGLPMAAGQVAAGLILAMQWSGDLDGADRLSQVGYDDGIRRGADLIRGVSALHLGVGALWRGRVRTAAALLREAVAALHENDVGLLGWAVDNLRAAVALCGGPPPDVPDPPCRHGLYETERHRLDACVRAARSDGRGAVELAMRAAEVARESGLHAQVAFALFDVVRYGGGSTAVIDELSAVAATSEGRLFPALAAGAVALLRHDAAALEVTSDRLEGFGFVLFAAELIRAAGVAHAQDGMRARAITAERRASHLERSCEG
ncbi:MAG TPA: hypothetical protein VK461_08210, partial [Acidimicrobiales bacterium]|nr:hypothetical protein [Acidimicrobiales bacterium]